jgi:hypothetical protein
MTDESLPRDQTTCCSMIAESAKYRSSRDESLSRDQMYKTDRSLLRQLIVHHMMSDVMYDHSSYITSLTTTLAHDRCIILVQTM